MVRFNFCGIGLGLVTAAYFIGHYALSGFLLVLVLLAMIALISLALQLDYVLAMSKPEALKTWTLRSLSNAIYDLTDGNYSDSTRLYVEGVNAYHPINGAFFAHIGGAPVVVLQPSKEDTPDA